MRYFIEQTRPKDSTMRFLRRDMEDKQHIHTVLYLVTVQKYEVTSF